jgi:paraquat-inducible protein B
MLYIQLDFHPDKPPVFADLNGDTVQIPTIPTDLELLARKVEEIDPAQLADKVQATIVGLNNFVINPAFQAMPANLQDTLASLRELSSELRTQVATSGPKLDKALDGATVALADTNRNLSGFFVAVDKNLTVLATAIAAFEATIDNVDNLVAPDSATTYQLNQALQDLSLASRAIRQLAETLNEQPESLLRGKRENDQ